MTQGRIHRPSDTSLTVMFIFQVSDAVHLLHGGNARYDSPHIFNEMLSCISTVLAASVKEDVEDSPFIGIGVDESTDRGSEKHLAIVVRYVSKEYVPEDRFPGLREGKLALSNIFITSFVL